MSTILEETCDDCKNHLSACSCDMSDSYNEMMYEHAKEIESDQVKKHLQWIHDRMVNVHKENENYDYMTRFQEIINKL